MRILVAFKRVPDAGTDWVSKESMGGYPWIINPFDQIAIEEAVRIKERGEADEILGVTVGTEAAEEQIRSALAMGVDRAVRIDDSRELDPFTVARILEAVVRREAPGLVVMGKQAVDDDSCQTGQMLAGLLGWPQATFVSRVELLGSGQLARCARETDQGLETIQVRLPAVLTTDLRLNEPRYVSLPGLMKARRKPIAVLTCGDLGIAVNPRTTVVATTSVPKRSAGARCSSVEDLLSRLRLQEKVL